MQQDYILDQLNSALDYVERAQKALGSDTLAMRGNGALSDLITRFAAIRDLHARLKGITAAVNTVSERLSTQLVPEAMEAAGFSTVNHRVGRVSLSTRISATILDRDSAFSWLRDHGKGDLIIETVNAQTLSATAREMMQAGDELPSDLFKTSTKLYTRITAPGASKELSHASEE